MSWKSYAVCTICNYKKEAPFDSLFHAVGRLGCCPKCGTEIEEYKLEPIYGRPFVTKIMRCYQVNRGEWLKPWTWFTWETIWETK